MGILSQTLGSTQSHQRSPTKPGMTSQTSPQGKIFTFTATTVHITLSNVGTIMCGKTCLRYYQCKSYKYIVGQLACRLSSSSTRGYMPIAPSGVEKVKWKLSKPSECKVGSKLFLTKRGVCKCLVEGPGESISKDRKTEDTPKGKITHVAVSIRHADLIYGHGDNMTAPIQLQLISTLSKTSTEQIKIRVDVEFEETNVGITRGMTTGPCNDESDTCLVILYEDCDNYGYLMYIPEHHINKTQVAKVKQYRLKFEKIDSIRCITTAEVRSVYVLVFTPPNYKVLVFKTSTISRTYKLQDTFHTRKSKIYSMQVIPDLERLIVVLMHDVKLFKTNDLTWTTADIHGLALDEYSCICINVTESTMLVVQNTYPFHIKAKHLD